MADGITAVKVGSKQRRQFSDVFADVIPFSLVFEDDSILDGDNYSGGGLVTVPGAALGDVVLVFPVLDAVETQFYGNVQAANSVEITLQNTTGGTVTAFLNGVTLRGVVLKWNDQIWSAPDAY